MCTSVLTTSGRFHLAAIGISDKLRTVTDTQNRILPTNFTQICLKRIFISGMYTDGTMFDGKEDHVWMDKSGFEEYAIGDGVSFGAEVYRYVKPEMEN